MTTIVGIRAERGKKSIQGVILGSDLAATREEWKPVGSRAYKQETKRGVQKIRVSKDKCFALGMAGFYDPAYHDFLDALLDGKYDLPKIFADKKFPQFREMNLSRWGKKNPGLDQANSVIIASRFDNSPKLYMVEPWGDVDDYGAVAIGSGSEFVHDYWRVMEPNMPNITMKKAIDLIDISLTHGNRDMHSVGFDFAIIQPDSITTYTREIQRAYSSARRDILREAKKRFG